MVLDIEKYQMDIHDASGLAKKQVGSRKVTTKEVQRSLTCGFISTLREDIVIEPELTIYHSPW